MTKRTLSRATLAVACTALLAASCSDSDKSTPDASVGSPDASSGAADGGPDGGAAATTTEGTPDAATPSPDAEATNLTPGQFSSPLVRLQRLQGAVGHLHVDEIRYRASDAKLFQCSYTFGVIDAKDPTNMKYLAENIKHVIPGDMRSPGCIHLAWDGDIVYTTHRGNLNNPTFITGWDISKKDPVTMAMKPQQLPVLQEPGESYEGIDVENGLVYVAIRDNGMAVYRRDPMTNVLSRIGSLGGLGSTWGLRVVSGKVYVTDILGSMSIVDVADPTMPKLLGKVAINGVAKGLVVDGTTAYVAAGGAGVVVVDVHDPANPKVIGHADTRGEAIRVAYSGGYIAVAAWNDTRVYDVSNPATPRFIGAVRLTTDVAYPDDGHPPVTARSMGIAMNGKDIFIGNWWVQYTYRLYPDRVAPNLVLPEDVNLLDVGPVPAGVTKTVPLDVKNQGTAPLTLFGNWTTGTAFTVSPAQLRLAPGESGTLTITYKGTTTDKQISILNVWSDDPLQPVRTGFLVANQPGLGVGKPFPETKAQLLDGSDWTSTKTTGKVTLFGYFATFCPVCSVEVRDFEDRFKKKYGDKIEIVKLDANGDPLDGVQAYVKNLHLSYTVGLEDPTTKTYAALTENYKGANPFPVDTVIGKDGNIVYIAREYDPGELTDVIDAELAK
jgi:peroxiredoxin